MVPECHYLGKPMLQPLMALALTVLLGYLNLLATQITQEIDKPELKDRL
jgi:hypothetical protein